MIGHYLLALTEAQEDRVLTQTMVPGCYWPTDFGGPCLVGKVADFVHGIGFCDYGAPRTAATNGLCVEELYDHACKKFGTARVNNAIRARILSNRLWRTLQNRPASEPGVIIGASR